MENHLRDIIRKLGGTAAVSRECQCNMSTVTSWMRRGSVPDAAKTTLVAMADRLGADVTLAHFFPELKESA